MKLLFWPVAPRRRADRLGRYDRDAHWHLRVLTAARGAQKRAHVASCPLPPTTDERERFLCLCAERLKGHAHSVKEVEFAVSLIDHRLHDAATNVPTVAEVTVDDGRHDELRRRARAAAGRPVAKK